MGGSFLFCSRCGKEVKADSKFCPSCGAAVNSPPMSNEGQTEIPTVEQAQTPAESGATQENIPPTPSADVPRETTSTQSTGKKKGTPKEKIIIAVAVVAAIVLVSSLFGGGPVKTVKTGKLNAYPEQTVGDAFAGFFSNPEWTSYEQGGDTYIKFTGKCTLYGEMVNAKVVFLIDGNNFSIDSFKVGNLNVTSSYDLESILDKKPYSQRDKTVIK